MVKNEVALQVTPVYMKIEAVMQSGLYKYIILKGSSRSSKTFSLIDIIDLYARTKRNKRVTVWRDTKVDAVDTVFSDMKRRLSDTDRWQRGNKFNATKHFLNYKTGSEIQIHGADDLSSVHGLTQDIAWMNEPYKISKAVFDQIDQRTTEFMFIDWNPRLAHWIDDIAKDERAIVIHSTFKDNPFCPEESKRKNLSYQPVSRCRIVENKKLTEDLAQIYDCVNNPMGFDNREIKELARCQANEYKKSASNYNWSVYGLGEKAEQPNRIFKWQEIPLHEYNSIDAKIYTYCDWGVVDPWAIGDVKYYDGALYVRELNYQSENEIREKLSNTDRAVIGGPDDEGIVIWMFNKLGIPTTREIICDSNRPRKIMALRSAGFDYAIGPAKRQNSIIDGISALQNLKVYYTSDSPNISNEQENYSRRTFKDEILEEPEDFNNHHCFRGETLITTDKGDKRIDNIEPGDNVLTSEGYKAVLKKLCNGYKQIFEYSIQLDTFCLSLICTPDHLIKTNKGWTKISQLEPGNTVSHIKHLTESNIFCTQTRDISNAARISCTGMFGNTIEEKYQKDSIFTTKTIIRGITESKTLNSSKGQSITAGISKDESRIIPIGSENFNKRESRPQKNGIRVKRGGNGTVNTEKRLTKKESQKPKYANFVKKNIPQSITGFQNSVIKTVKQRPAGKELVYDLTVEDRHEYFANGLLVHNCDGIRYVCIYLQDEGIINVV